MSLTGSLVLSCPVLLHQLPLTQYSQHEQTKTNLKSLLFLSLLSLHYICLPHLVPVCYSYTKHMGLARLS